MSSRKGGGKPFSAGIADSSAKGKHRSLVSSPGVNQLNHGVTGMSLDSAQDGEWEVYNRKPKNRAGSSAAKPWVPQNTNPKAWGHVDVIQKLGMRSNDGSEKGPGNTCPTPIGEVDDEDVMDEVDESDDELDDFYSDESHKRRWLEVFFENLDNLTTEQISEPTREWHCPACQAGPGAIDCYTGLRPLISHAKTKGSKRVKHHQKLAALLDEELCRRGISVVPAGEAYGKWKGLNNIKDKEIVWPPMVVIMNTQLDKDENERWIGMGNQELLDYFSSFDAIRARHSYGPRGHRGMSLLIFEASAVGYSEAERLSKHFEDQGTDKEAWDRRRVLFYPGGQRQLYGYMAEKEDLDSFNQHSQGKSKLKFEMKSYQESVVNQLKQMSEDNQQVIWLKNRYENEKKHVKALEETIGSVSDKLRKTSEENRIVIQRSKMHHEQNKEEMYSQEQFFKDQIKVIENARDAKEDNFEKIQQEEREKVKQSCSNRRSEEKVVKFIKSQDKKMEEFVRQRERLVKLHEDKKVELKRRQWEEEVRLENDLDAELTQLMDKYTHTPLGGRQQQ